MTLTSVLVDLVPEEAEAQALAALVRYAEARRPARFDAHGMMVPLSDQDPALWCHSLIEEADKFFARSLMEKTHGPRALQAAIHGVWCKRTSLADPPPWAQILALYDLFLTHRDDVVVRLNRAVALAEVAGVEPALDEVNAMASEGLRDFTPYHALRADLLRRSGRINESREAYDAALALGPASAERMWLRRQRQMLGD